MSKVDAIIAAMPAMQRSEVEAQWNKLGAGEAPRLPDPLFRRLTAQMLQERRYGDVPAIIRRELARLTEVAPEAAESSRPPVMPIRISDGTRLIREWNGRTIEVLVRDDAFEWEGRPMSPSHSTRKSANADGTAQRRRYRYYQTRPGAEGGVAWRVTASDIEPLIRSRLAAFLEDQQAIIAMAADRSAEVINATLSSALGMAAKLRSQATGECRDTIEQIVRRIDLAQDSIAITVNNVGLRIQFGLTEVPSEECAIEEIVLHCPVVKVRRGHALRLILPPSTPAVPQRQRDEKLVQLVAEAHAARKLVLENPRRAVASIAADHGRCRTRLAKLVGLSCLAPDIVTAIVEGRQPAKLTAKVLTTIDLPLCWGEQRAALEF